MAPFGRDPVADARRDLQGGDTASRAAAIETLRRAAARMPSIRAAAAEVLRDVVRTSDEPWPATAAARALADVAGPDAAHEAWLTLLDPARGFVAACATLGAAGPRYVPALARLADTLPIASWRSYPVRALGRVRGADDAVLPTLVRHLADPELRPHAVEALRELGDRRALPHLQPLLTDTADAWEEDNHGPMLRVCDLARSAIAGLDSRVR